jgi:hypothetical protein
MCDSQPTGLVAQTDYAWASRPGLSDRELLTKVSGKQADACSSMEEKT